LENVDYQIFRVKDGKIEIESWNNIKRL
jgi:hypothetical protein